MDEKCETCEKIQDRIDKAYMEGNNRAFEMQKRILAGHLANTCLKIGTAIVVWKIVTWILGK